MNYIAFFTGYFAGRHVIWKWAVLFLSLSLLVAVYRIFRVIQSNKPFIEMSPLEFTYYKKDVPTSYRWTDITKWERVRLDNNNFLILEVFGAQDKIRIDWLDKSPAQIEEMVLLYLDAQKAGTSS